MTRAKSANRQRNYRALTVDTGGDDRESRNSQELMLDKRFTRIDSGISSSSCTPTPTQSTPHTNTTSSSGRGKSSTHSYPSVPFPELYFGGCCWGAAFYIGKNTYCVPSCTILFLFLFFPVRVTCTPFIYLTHHSLPHTHSKVYTKLCGKCTDQICTVLVSKSAVTALERS